MASDGGRYGDPCGMGEWMIYASSGKYTLPAESADYAFLRFVDQHPGDFVHVMQLKNSPPGVRGGDFLFVLLR
jgi:hypothetical protein